MDYTVGNIINIHGIKGELKIRPITNFAKQRFKKGNNLYITTNPKTEVKIATSRLHKKMWLISFEGKDNINDVEQYKGLDLVIDETQREALSDNEFYYDEIIGLEAVDDMTNEKIGVIKEIMPLAHHDILVVERAKRKDALIPMKDDFVTNIDLEQGVIQIDVREGLLD